MKTVVKEFFQSFVLVKTTTSPRAIRRIPPKPIGKTTQSDSIPLANDPNAVPGVRNERIRDDKCDCYSITGDQ